MSKRYLAVMMVLVLTFSFLPVVMGSSSPNYAVIDPALEHRLSVEDGNEPIEVIIQLHDTIEERDLAYLRINGFTILQTFDVMPVIHAKGVKQDIEDLSNYERVRWIEFNAPMQYYMNMTKYTIEAQDVWLSQIRIGEEIFDPIDGSGVTVVVLDSGIDATHPDLDYDPVNIEGGETPEIGQKVIFNVKKDQDGVGEPFIPFENTDTTSGHGTHCAGTVAGNGQASAGRVQGIAPNAWLIGVSMGEGFATIDEYSGLVWTYDHSMPEDNPANIRVVTNSWGPGYPFDSLDPNDASAQMIMKLAHENNVAVVFAAGNDGGSNHDGATDTVNIFAKVPAAISVAASTRDGTGLAGFSSRGDIELVETWPDIAAPGVRIWSASARATMIGAGIGLQDLTRDENDPFYIAISGTSMATPHVAGLLALLWQACPSMTMSDELEDYEGDLPMVIQENADNFDQGPYSFDDLRIHESELILKLTSGYIEPEGNNGIPTGNGSTRKGLEDRTFDYAQGYGLVNAKRAVALALKLQYMRDPNMDGFLDHPEITVIDAYHASYGKIIREGSYSAKTDMISHTWDGEFVDSDKVIAELSAVYDDTVPTSDQRHSVYIPEETERMVIAFTYNPLYLEYDGITDIPEASYGYLYMTIDVDGDGNHDYPMEAVEIPNDINAFDPTEEQTVKIPISFNSDPFMNARGRNWTFNMMGYAYGIGGAFWDLLIGKGTRMAYHVDIQLRVNAEDKPKIPYAGFWFEEQSTQYFEGKTYIHQNWYVLKDRDNGDDDFILSAETGISLVLILILGLTASWLHLKKKFGLLSLPMEEEGVEWEIQEKGE